MYANYLGDDQVQVTFESDDLEAVIDAVKTGMDRAKGGLIDPAAVTEFLQEVEYVQG
ncbi:hypothetical protein RCO28_12695 [Streptomyces sp. LHD-70]|uniref:hypothetical protein n=1 Tax=Streptomyces sp. LHD-70 TaxID=3072140 RepID=UPI00280FE680|nr:hypothetical protein [Streptomyces sp. LHD-70]MDQ8703340.1 hypothetical protein [Streptomyces sp. LHD-70]